MIGATIGDTIGSIYEFNNIKTKEFELFSPFSIFTDDSLMTFAVGSALMKAQRTKRPLRSLFVEEMKRIGGDYPNPMGGYGSNFALWLKGHINGPYGSFGNGSAMRASPCGLVAVTLEEALDLARVSAEVTHDHPEGIKGAQAVAAAVFLAKAGKTKGEILTYIEAQFYRIDFTVDQIRPAYHFNSSCQGTVPQALCAFFESKTFEDAIRIAVSLGGDTDTLTAITGSVAWSYYKNESPDLPDDMVYLKEQTMSRLPDQFKTLLADFDAFCKKRKAEFERTGKCLPFNLT